MNKRLLLHSAMMIIMALAMTIRISAETPKTDNAATAKPAKLYGVAFYNLENLFDTINNNGKYDLDFSPQGKYQWDGKKYHKKLNNIATAISKMPTEHTPEGPAIIGVSEIENKTVLDDLVATGPIAGKYKVIHHDSPDRRGVDVSLLYNPELFRPLTITNHTLRIDSIPWFRTRDQMCVVGLLGNRKVGYNRIAVIVNHWPSRRGGSEQSSYLREAAAALSKHIADSLLNIDPQMGIIIMGDLNDSPYDKSLTKVLKARKDVKDVKKGEFFNPFWRLLDNGIGSYIYRGGWDLFDQIVISRSLMPGNTSGLEYVGALVFNKEFLRQPDGKYKGYPFRTFSEGAFINGYSDHFPTEIFLKQEIRK